MAWRRSGDKPLSEPMMVSLPTHIYASLGLNEAVVNIGEDFEFCLITTMQANVLMLVELLSNYINVKLNLVILKELSRIWHQ